MVLGSDISSFTPEEEKNDFYGNCGLWKSLFPSPQSHHLSLSLAPCLYEGLLWDPWGRSQAVQKPTGFSGRKGRGWCDMLEDTSDWDVREGHQQQWRD